MSKRAEKSPDVNIFQLLAAESKKERRKRRKEILAPLGIEEFFEEGNISIKKRTCQGVECKLCIKACPTNALFWKAGEIGLTEDLCIYCGACVLSCIVDDCIIVTRKNSTGELETFSKPKDFLTLQNVINTKKRVERVKEVFPEIEIRLRQHKIKKQ